MLRPIVATLCLVSTLGMAQNTPPIANDPSTQPKVIIVPYPGEVIDAGPVASPPPTPQPVDAAPSDAPLTPPEALPSRTFQATPAPPPDVLTQLPPESLPLPTDGPGAFLDGHPREGAFLSGPGSLMFVMHHTLLTGLGTLGAFMAPRVDTAGCFTDNALGRPCTPNPQTWTGGDARLAYLAGTLIGAAVGFGASAAWQFTHWMSTSTATFGIVNSFFGGAFGGAIADLAAQHQSTTAVGWASLVGSLAGAWLTPIIGGGDLAVNKGILITSGGAWAMIYTSLILAIVSTIGGGGNVRAGLDAIFITPAIGAAAMALASLRFNPSTTQIMRANLFGLGAGAAVLLISALVLGANFAHPVPYILAAVAAIGAKVTVSLLWAEAAEAPQQNPNVFIPRTEAEKRVRVLYW